MSELGDILRQLHFDKITASEALDRAIPLLRDKVSRSEYEWLVGEHDGLAIPEGDEVIEGGLSPHMKSYRLVYPDGLALRDSNGSTRRINNWPQGENRLQLVGWKLADIEARIAETNDEFAYPPCLLNIPPAPDGQEVRLVVHKSQLHRICESFKQELIKVAGPIAQEEES